MHEGCGASRQQLACRQMQLTSPLSGAVTANRSPGTPAGRHLSSCCPVRQIIGVQSALNATATRSKRLYQAGWNSEDIRADPDMISDSKTVHAPRTEQRAVQYRQWHLTCSLNRSSHGCLLSR